MNNKLNNSSDQTVLAAKNISKTYQDGGKQTQVLTDLSMNVQAGESVAIIGSSGSGKSTLLHLLGGLDRPSTGEVWIKGQNLSQLNDTQLGNVRNQHLGFVYQFHHLLPEFTALENVAMPLLMRQSLPVKEAEAQAESMITKVGLKQRLDHKPGMLSGGERQRIAIARALVTQPTVVLADEPTGNLDQSNAEMVFELLKGLQESMGMALVMVTHDQALAKRVNRMLCIQNGSWA